MSKLARVNSIERPIHAPNRAGSAKGWLDTTDVVRRWSISSESARVLHRIMKSKNTSPRSSAILRWSWRLALCLWAGFWAWFVLVVSVGEEPTPPLWIPIVWLASLALLTALGWRAPAIGGAALLAAGGWCWWYFANDGARTLLAAPAIALGVVALLLSWRQRSLAAALALLCAGVLGSCATPQDPRDLPYASGSFLRHESGALQRARLVEPTEVAGWPCQSWIWWHADGSLDNFELAREFTVASYQLPAGTRVFLDREGRLAHAWLSRDTLLDGHTCRGRFKIDTAFHPNGRVKAFFPPDDVEIDGVLCKASVFHPVYLHATGRLQQCKLARDAAVDGVSIEAGSTLRLDEHGRVASVR
jgi:hypothetical protein